MQWNTELPDSIKSKLFKVAMSETFFFDVNGRAMMVNPVDDTIFRIGGKQFKKFVKKFDKEATEIDKEQFDKTFFAIIEIARKK